jgi:ferrous iron transport protein B
VPIFQLDYAYQTEKLENAGIWETIEPAIAPSSASTGRSVLPSSLLLPQGVFVGTMATLYSVGDEDEGSLLLKEKMKTAVRPDGKLVFNLATGLSLMIFYVFAMQCMSTLAVVKRETRGWKWPIIQLLYMTGLAYVMSWVVYQLFR